MVVCPRASRGGKVGPDQKEVDVSDRRLQRAKAVTVQELDGQFLLLKAGSADVVHLNPVASDVWRLLEQARSRNELVDAVAQSYSVAPEQVEVDLAPLMETLLAHGLVEEETKP
jgi:hypothetical protein